MAELLNLRTKTQKVFDLGGGVRNYQCHIGNIHYPDSVGVFQDIDTTLISQVGGFYQDKCFYSCEIPATADGVFSFFNRDHFVDLKVVGVKGVGYVPIPNSRWGELGKGIQYTDAFGVGIHLEIIAKNMKFDKRIRFDGPPPDITQDFVVDFELLSVPDTVAVNGVTATLAATTLAAPVLIDKTIALMPSTGKFQSFIQKPFCNDSDGKFLPVGIQFYTSLGKTYLRKIIPKEIFAGAVYPIFADDPVRYDPTAGDGSVENGYFAWDTAHDGTVGNGAYYTGTEIEVGDLSGSPSTIFKFLRGFIPIDTSGIADGDTVTAATLYMYGSSLYRNHDNDGDDWLSTVQTDQPSPTALTTADFNNCGAIDNPTEGNDSGDRIDITNWSVVGYNTINLNATGLGWINKTGVTMLGVREGHDCIDSPLVIGGVYQGNHVALYSSERTGTAEDPYLDVTTAGGGDLNINVHDCSETAERLN